MADKNVQMPDGRVISFPGTMSDDDISGILKQQSGAGWSMTEQQQKVADAAQQANQAYAQNMAQEGQRKLQDKFLPIMNPFSYLQKQWTGNPNPTVGKALDVTWNTLPLLINAAKTGASIPSAPDTKTGISRAGLALSQTGQGAMSAVIPGTFAIGKGIGTVAQTIDPRLGRAVSNLANLTQSIINPQTEIGRNAAEATDIGIQSGLAQAVTNPVKFVRETLGRVVPEDTAVKLAARAGKFTGTPDQVLKKADISLRENIKPGDKASFDRLNQVVSDIDNQVGAYGKSTDLIQTDNLMRNIEGLVKKARTKELLPDDAENQIRGIVNDFYVQRGEQVPADLAHQIKKGIYERDTGAYQQQALTGKVRGLDTKTEMAIANGILGEWKNLYPETAPLLERQSDLLSIKKDVARTVRGQMIKSPLPQALLLAISPRWWLMKMIASNRSLEYNLGRLLYRGRTQVANSTQSAIPPPYMRPTAFPDATSQWLQNATFSNKP